MEKSNSKGGSRKGAGRKPRGNKAMSASIRILGSEEWKVAVTEFAAWNHADSVADLIDEAIAYYARAKEYPKPIPRR